MARSWWADEEEVEKFEAEEVEMDYADCGAAKSINCCRWRAVLSRFQDDGESNQLHKGIKSTLDIFAYGFPLRI